MKDSSIPSLFSDNPIKKNAGLDIYELPKEQHDYVITVDVARGVGEDYSAFVCVDLHVTDKLVCI